MKTLRGEPVENPESCFLVVGFLALLAERLGYGLRRSLAFCKTVVAISRTPPSGHAFLVL